MHDAIPELCYYAIFTSKICQNTCPHCLIRPELLSTTQFIDMMTPWEFKQHVCDLLQYYADKVCLVCRVLWVRFVFPIAESVFFYVRMRLCPLISKQGDCQTAVSMLIVLNSELKDLIDENVQEQWFTAYIGNYVIF